MLGFSFSFSSADVSDFSLALQRIWCWWKVLACPPRELSPVEALSREAEDPGCRLLCSSGFNDGRGNGVYTKPSPSPRNSLLCLCCELSLRLWLFGRAIRTFLHLTDFTSIPWSHREIWLWAPAPDIPLFSLSLMPCSPASERSLCNGIMQPCKWTWFFSFTANHASGLPLQK